MSQTGPIPIYDVENASRGFMRDRSLCVDDTASNREKLQIERGAWHGGGKFPAPFTSKDASGELVCGSAPGWEEPD